ncbi:MAG: VanZ family protein [Sphingobacteriaceae bacterium]|nr:VanZ family protein [Sphingobacteriaceae bacterium]
MIKPKLLPIVIYLSFILILYISPNNVFSIINNSNILGLRIDYILHVIFLIPLPLLIYKYTALKSSQVIVITLLISFSIEFIHILLPYRSFNKLDVLANLFGSLFGIIVHIIFLVATKKTKPYFINFNE